MFRFPTEFGELLSQRGRRILHGKVAPTNRAFILLTDVINRSVGNECKKILDSRLYNQLQTINCKIPDDSISEMTRNYSESLGKTLRIKTAFFQKKNARSYQVADEIGLLQMMGSESLAVFAEKLTGTKLSREVGRQVICYSHGDYVGPHTDHYPENESLRDGYVDLHLMFTSPAVDHHWLVYGNRGHFSEIVNINVHGVAAYKLPFWHYTTPMTARPGHEANARRWVLLTTFAQL